MASHSPLNKYQKRATKKRYNKCVFHGCPSRGNCTFHRIPWHSPKLRNKWIKAILDSGTSSSLITRNSRVCYKHFPSKRTRDSIPFAVVQSETEWIDRFQSQDSSRDMSEDAKTKFYLRCSLMEIKNEPSDLADGHYTRRRIHSLSCDTVNSTNLETFANARNREEEMKADVQVVKVEKMDDLYPGNTANCDLVKVDENIIDETEFIRSHCPNTFSSVGSFR